MGGKSAPSPPDLSGLTNAELQISQQQLKQAQQQMGISQNEFNQYMQLNQQQLAQSNTQYNQQLGIQQQQLAQAAQANQTSENVANTQIASMNQSMQYAAQDRQRYNDTTIPLQNQYIAEAQAYSDPAHQAAAASQALADNQTQLEAQRNNQMAQLASMGIDPSQVMSSSLSSQLGVAGAAQGAMAANTARQQTIQTGYGMLGNAINMVNNLPAQTTSEMNSATGAGNSANSAAQSTNSAYNSAVNTGAVASGIRENSLNTASQLTGSPLSWAQLGNQSYGGASNGVMNAGNLMNQGYQNQMSQFNANLNASNSMMSGIGTIASIAGMAMMAEGGAVGDASTLGNDPISGVDTALPVDTSQLDSSIQNGVTNQMNSATMAPSTGSLFGNPGLGAQLQAAGKQLQSVGGRQYSTQGKNFLQPIYYRAEGGVMGPGGMPMNNAPPQQHRGAVPSMASRDTIAARLSPGEYVIPADVVHQLGVSHFDKLIQKYHRAGA